MLHFFARREAVGIKKFIREIKKALSSPERKVFAEGGGTATTEELRTDLALVSARLLRQQRMISMITRMYEETNGEEDGAAAAEKNYFERLFRLEALMEKTEEQRIKLLLKLGGLEDGDGHASPAEAWLAAVCDDEPLP